VGLAPGERASLANLRDVDQLKVLRMRGLLRDRRSRRLVRQNGLLDDPAALGRAAAIMAGSARGYLEERELESHLERYLHDVHGYASIDRQAWP
jgi:hypothetical protein